MNTNIVITGVGGQGAILVSHILAEAAKESGLTVYVGEVHGMAQRGGTVITYVRMGDVYSSLVAEGEATILLGLEIGESYRAKKYISPDTWVVTNKRKIIPLSVTRTGAVYPEVEEIESALRKYCKNLLSVDATNIAEESGNIISENIVMLGVMVSTNILPVNKEVIEGVLLRRIPEKWHEVNLKAFRTGFKKGIKLQKV